MATIKIDRFFGIAPRIQPTLLQDGMAVRAENVKLKSGKLVPMKKSIRIGIRSFLENGMQDISDAKTMHVWRLQSGDAEIVAFPGQTWFANGNIADDDMTRAIVSGDTGVRFIDDEGVWHDNAPQIYMRNKNGSKIVHQLCKRTLSPLKVSRVSVVPLDDNRRYTYFFVTWVDEYGYESPVSGPSMVFDEDVGKWVVGDLEYLDGDVVSASALPSYDVFPEAKAYRIYKVVTNTEGTGNIQFIKEFSPKDVVDSFSFRVKDEDAGEIIREIESPPYDLVNVIRVFGGGDFYVGFSRSAKKTVCFSDIGYLYSWPMAYRYDVEYNIVAIASTSNVVYVLTDGYPYVISGTSPDVMSIAQLAGSAACVSPRSVCVYKNAVYYASHEGICYIYNDANAGTVVTNITDKIWTKEQWQSHDPSSCVIGQHDGVLHVFLENEGKKFHYCIDLNEGNAAVTTCDDMAECMCEDTKTGRLLFVKKVEVPNE